VPVDPHIDNILDIVLGIGLDFNEMVRRLIALKKRVIV